MPPGHALPNFQPVAFGSSSTAAFSPSDVSGLTHWFDAQDASSVTTSGAEITEVANQVSGGLDLVNRATGGPDYEASNSVAGNQPAFVWPTLNNGEGLWLGSDVAVKEIFSVMAYKDGLDSAFDTFNTFFCSVSGISSTAANQRIMGDSTKDSIRGGTTAPSSLQLSVDGGAGAGVQSVALLPLPLSVLHFYRATDFDITGVGTTSGGTGIRAWKGPICEVLFYDEVLSAEDRTSVVSYLTEKWGL